MFAFQSHNRNRTIPVFRGPIFVATQESVHKIERRIVLGEPLQTFPGVRPDPARDRIAGRRVALLITAAVQVEAIVGCSKPQLPGRGGNCPKPQSSGLFWVALFRMPSKMYVMHLLAGFVRVLMRSSGSNVAVYRPVASCLPPGFISVGISRAVRRTVESRETGAQVLALGATGTCGTNTMETRDGDRHRPHGGLRVQISGRRSNASTMAPPDARTIRRQADHSERARSCPLIRLPRPTPFPAQDEPC